MRAAWQIKKRNEREQASLSLRYRCGNGLFPVMMTLTLYHCWQPLAPLYGGDNELTTGMQKSSNSPFDMLRGKLSAKI